MSTYLNGHFANEEVLLVTKDGLKSPAVFVLRERVDEVILLEVPGKRFAPLLALEEILLKIQHLGLK